MATATHPQIAPYASVHADTQGVGDARPTALQIIKDQGLVGKLNDKVMLVTGCSSGIGIETARALHETGAKVFLTARDVKKGAEVAQDIRDRSEIKSEVVLIEMDLSSLASVRKGAAEILRQTDRLNIIVNNAGVMATPEGRTVDGFETQFGTNHVAHFLLFQLLRPTLLASSSSSFPSRVVCVSSMGHRSGGVQFDDLDFSQSGYDPWKAYGQAKTANILMANQISRNYAPKIQGLSLHPGGIASGLQKHLPKDFFPWEDPKVKAYLKSPEQGAATSVWAAVAKELDGVGGVYLEDCQIVGPAAADGLAIGRGYKPWAMDEEAATKLWTVSNQLVDVSE